MRVVFQYNVLCWLSCALCFSTMFSAGCHARCVSVWGSLLAAMRVVFLNCPLICLQCISNMFSAGCHARCVSKLPVDMFAMRLQYIRERLQQLLIQSYRGTYCVFSAGRFLLHKSWWSCRSLLLLLGIFLFPWSYVVVTFYLACRKSWTSYLPRLSARYLLPHVFNIHPLWINGICVRTLFSWFSWLLLKKLTTSTDTDNRSTILLLTSAGRFSRPRISNSVKVSLLCQSTFHILKNCSTTKPNGTCFFKIHFKCNNRINV